MIRAKLPTRLPTNTEATAQDTLPPSTEAIVVSTDSPAAAPAALDLAAAASPASWNFTATKTESVKPAPDFITATPIGAGLPWSVAVAESCNGGACSYTSEIRPLLPEVVIGEVPVATWVVDGPEWSLDATWASGSPDCPIEDHWTYGSP